MTSVSINLNPSNLGANFSEEDDPCDAEFSLLFFVRSSSQGQRILQEDAEEMAVAEAAATEAAMTPDFFMIARD